MGRQGSLELADQCSPVGALARPAAQGLRVATVEAVRPAARSPPPVEVAVRLEPLGGSALLGYDPFLGRREPVAVALDLRQLCSRSLAHGVEPTGEPLEALDPLEILICPDLIPLTAVSLGQLEFQPRQPPARLRPALALLLAQLAQAVEPLLLAPLDSLPHLPVPARELLDRRLGHAFDLEVAAVAARVALDRIGEVAQPVGEHRPVHRRRAHADGPSAPATRSRRSSPRPPGPRRAAARASAAAGLAPGRQPPAPSCAETRSRSARPAAPAPQSHDRPAGAASPHGRRRARGRRRRLARVPPRSPAASPPNRAPTPPKPTSAPRRSRRSRPSPDRSPPPGAVRARGRSGTAPPAGCAAPTRTPPGRPRARAAPARAARGPSGPAPPGARACSGSSRRAPRRPAACARSGTPRTAPPSRSAPSPGSARRASVPAPSDGFGAPSA